MSILEILGNNKFWNIAGGGMAHHNVRCTGAHSSRTSGIMANSGFGAMSLIIDGKKIMLPAVALTKKGTVRKSWADIVSSRNVEALLAKGATITVA